MSIPAGQRIVPVNHAMHGDAIVVRTTPYSELGTYGWKTDLAFEIDHIDHEAHRGWSVLITGRGAVVDDPDEIDDIRATWHPQPLGVGGTHAVPADHASGHHRPPARQRLDARDDGAGSPVT
jgi:hypothetical protein